MERDINVVVRIKEDGTMSFVSGDGLPLKIGGGDTPEKEYPYMIVGLCQENHDAVDDNYLEMSYATPSNPKMELIDLHAVYSQYKFYKLVYKDDNFNGYKPQEVMDITFSSSPSGSTIADKGRSTVLYDYMNLSGDTCQVQFDFVDKAILYLQCEFQE